MAKQRKHGSGTVRLRSDGRWEGRVVIGYDDSGLPKTKNVLAKTKAECEKKLKSLIAAQKGSEPQPPRQTSLKPESYWPIGWTSGIKDIKSQTSARTRRCPMNGGSISTSSQTWAPFH